MLYTIIIIIWHYHFNINILQYLNYMYSDFKRV